MGAWMLTKLPFGFGEQMTWINARGMVEEFGGLLEGQLDLREEAANLVRFNKNFADCTLGVRFPGSIKGFTDHASANVLVEEFVLGKPVMQWAIDHKEEKSLREHVCNQGIRAVCKMIFQDNFLHGDLHPGNLMITDKNEIVMLDVGIAKAFAKRDHDLLVSVLTCFIRANGRGAAACMADNSDHRLGTTSRPEDVELFADKIEAMVAKAKTDESFFDSLGSYFTTICNAASVSRVKMNQGFITMALAVKVIEGVALELNPEVEMWAIANPMLLKVAKRKWANVFDSLSIDKIMESQTCC
jgi:aarF domain-containing kinase